MVTMPMMMMMTVKVIAVSHGVIVTARCGVVLCRFSVRGCVHSRPGHTHVAQLSQPVPAQRRLRLDNNRAPARTHHIHRH